MMEIRPSRFAPRSVARVSRVILLCLATAVLSACVSQSDVLSVDTNLQPPSPQLGLATAPDPEGSFDDGSGFVASNIPQRAPRPTTVATNLSVTAATTPAAGDASTTTDQPETVLAAVDPATPTVPAQTAIESTAIGASTTSITENNAADATATIPENTATDSAQPEKPPVENPTSATLTQPVAVEKPRATGLFARLFQGNGASKEKQPKTKRPKRVSSGRGEDDGGIRIASAHATAKKKKSVRETIRLTKRNGTTSNGALPGVKSTSQLFGVTEEDSSSSRTPTTQLAAVGSLGRISANGIRVQHEKVQVACLKPGVLRMLKQVERHYGRKPIVTSGYRSPKRNRRAGGAKNSMHIYCKAADIQVEGISKWQLAKFLRTLPGRGGVGTYCRTRSVHIDTGSKRDWHHPCRRSSKRKKRST